MARKVRVKKVARLQEKYLREEGATTQEIRKWRPYLTAQIGAESNFQEGVGSSAGARDIAQFIPATARSYGVTLGDNRIRDDIRGQVRYMLPLLRRHGVEGALRGYNAGEGAIAASHGFGETNAYVDRILGTADRYELPRLGKGFGSGVKMPTRVGSLDPGVRPSLSAGSTTLDARGAMLDALLDGRKNMSLLDRFRERVDSGQYTTVVPPMANPGQMPKYLDPVKGAGHGQPGSPTGTVGSSSTPRFQRIEAEAERIDKAHVPYLWGGGHQGKQARGSRVTPLDCSGAVSRVLGINPLVSGQFMKWGKPGRGKNITIWANEEHVLMEIGGHFWGTSDANPGGGAGWIPREHISKAYLARFTPRHPG